MLSSTLALSSAALLFAPLISAAASGTAYSRAQIRVGADRGACLAWVDGSTGEVGLGGANLLIATCTTTEDPGRYNQITYSHFNLITGASSRIQIAGTNKCVVAPSGGFSNFGSVQAQDCSDSSTAWWITDDNHVAITGGNQCLDLNHPQTGPRYPQTYQCIGNNDNQIWIVDGTPASSPAPATTSATATATDTSAPTTVAATSAPAATTTATATDSAATTSAAATTSVAPAPSPSTSPSAGAGTYTQIHPGGNSDFCLTVLSNYHNGDRVFTYPCNRSNGITNVWEINRGNGLIKVRGTNFCLDAGTNPHNGVGMKIWQCYPGLTQQQWYYTDDNRIAITGGDQCLDLTDGILDNQQAQSWQCTTGNSNQVWLTSTSVVTQ